MNVGENAGERALPRGNFVGHAAFPKRSAAMLGQFGRLIQSDEMTARDQFRRMLISASKNSAVEILRPAEKRRTSGRHVFPGAWLLAGPDTGGEAADGGEVQIFVEPDGGAVLRGHGQC